MPNSNILNFTNGLLFLTIGLIFGKFISTAIIQLSIWDKVQLLGLKPSLKTTFKIFLQQVFLDWGSDLKTKDLAIKLITAIFFFTFWFRYGPNISFLYCCIFLIFIEFFIFAWLEKLKIPETVFIMFIFIGSTATFHNFSSKVPSSIFFLFLYFSINYFLKRFFIKKVSLEIFNNIKFIITLGVWFGMIATIQLSFFSYLLTIMIKEKNKHSTYFLLKPKYVNPLMGVFSLVYILFNFPIIL